MTNKHDSRQKDNIKMDDKKNIGITAAKEDDFTEWFTQLIIKAELIDYSPVSGCYILRPNAYSMWDTAKGYLNDLLIKDGVKNAYFPLFIPESLLMKEKEHVEGFTPEVAWVTESGNSKLPERLAVRPTSETIMYQSYSKWIRSHKDLPLRLNQWCNVVRWEFKNPVPFLRSREFLWQEGHTVFASREEAVDEARKMLGMYQQTLEHIMAVPCISGRKTDKEKFAGADFTLSIETFMPAGKGIQCCTSHHLGQNFSKAFGIKFVDKDEKSKFGWQNSWGFTTRTIGIMIMMHSDDKGLVIPPKMAPNRVAIVPIIFEDSKEKVISECHALAKELKHLNPIVDDSIDHTPGWKFNNYELKGVPLRIELGPKDLEKKQAVVVRRDTSEKKAVPLSEIKEYVDTVLQDIQQNLFEKAKSFIEVNTVECLDKESLLDTIKSKKMAKSFWCGSQECEDMIKDKIQGAKILNVPFDQPKHLGECVWCGKKAKYFVNIAKSY